MNLETRKWEWFKGYPKEFRANLSRFCEEVIAKMLMFLADFNFKMPSGPITKGRILIVKNFKQHYNKEILLSTVDEISAEIERLDVASVASLKASFADNLKVLPSTKIDKNIKAASTSEDMLKALKNTKLITAPLIVSFVQLMTSTVNATNIEKWSKIFEYQGFDALKFSQQIFLELYWSEMGVIAADQNETWLKAHMEVDGVKTVLEVIVKLILLFFIRGTSIIRDPQKKHD